MTKIEPVGYVHECEDYTMSIIRATKGEHPCPVAVYTEAQMRQLASSVADVCDPEGIWADEYIKLIKEMLGCQT